MYTNFKILSCMSKNILSSKSFIENIDKIGPKTIRQKNVVQKLSK